MFDTYVHRTEAVPYEKTVTHKLAPTAEHMRLLEDFRAEAQRKVETAVRVPTITLGEITTYQTDFQTHRVLFCINGHLHQADVDDSSLILEPVAWTIAELITRRIFDAIMQRNPPASPQDAQ